MNNFVYHSLCFISSEDAPGWEIDIQHDVIEECNKHGGVVHIYIDKNSAEVNMTSDMNESAANVTSDHFDLRPLLVFRETSTSSVPPSQLPWLLSTRCTEDTLLVRLPVR